MTDDRLTCAGVMGAAQTDAMRRARAFLLERTTEELLQLVGTVRPELAPSRR